jgi:hypothetical protein
VGHHDPIFSAEVRSAMWRDALLIALPIVSRQLRERRTSLPSIKERQDAIQASARELEVPRELREAYWRGVEAWALHALAQAERLLFRTPSGITGSGAAEAARA